MAIELLLGANFSSLAIRLACLVIINKQKQSLLTLGEELRSEVEVIIKQLNDLPENLGSVLAWETLVKC